MPWSTHKAMGCKVDRPNPTLLPAKKGQALAPAYDDTVEQDGQEKNDRF
jgi:hypothetical protein